MVTNIVYRRVLRQWPRFPYIISRYVQDIVRRLGNITSPYPHPLLQWGRFRAPYQKESFFSKVSISTISMSIIYTYIIYLRLVYFHLLQVMFLVLYLSKGIKSVLIYRPRQKSWIVDDLLIILHYTKPTQECV